MAAIRSFRDLKVYRQAVAEARNVFVMSGSFPPDERYSLTDQVRRSSRAVGAMIAEAWARRRYPAAFASKLNEALGEAMETQCWLDHALCCRYLGPAEHRKLDATWQAIGAMIQKMLHRADDFCRTAAD